MVRLLKAESENVELLCHSVVFDETILINNDQIVRFRITDIAYEASEIKQFLNNNNSSIETWVSTDFILCTETNHKNNVIKYKIKSIPNRNEAVSKGHPRLAAKWSKENRFDF